MFRESVEGGRLVGRWVSVGGWVLVVWFVWDIWCRIVLLDIRIMPWVYVLSFIEVMIGLVAVRVWVLT